MAPLSHTALRVTTQRATCTAHLTTSRRLATTTAIPTSRPSSKTTTPSPRLPAKTKTSPKPAPPGSTFFRISLRRSPIGLPAKVTGVLAALGLHRRTATVYHPVTPDVAGQILRVKELVDVSEVERALTRSEGKELRRPEPGYYVESKAGEDAAWETEETQVEGR